MDTIKLLSNRVDRFTSVLEKLQEKLIHGEYDNVDFYRELSRDALENITVLQTFLEGLDAEEKIQGTEIIAHAKDVIFQTTKQLHSAKEKVARDIDDLRIKSPRRKSPPPPSMIDIEK